jgi:hypothetical protein
MTTLSEYELPHESVDIPNEFAGSRGLVEEWVSICRENGVLALDLAGRPVGMVGEQIVDLSWNRGHCSILFGGDGLSRSIEAFFWALPWTNANESAASESTNGLLSARQLASIFSITECNGLTTTAFFSHDADGFYVMQCEPA